MPLPFGSDRIPTFPIGAMSTSSTPAASGALTSPGRTIRWPLRLRASRTLGRASADTKAKDGFLKDAEKYEAALQLGWQVYRVPGPWVAEGERAIWRAEVMETLRMLLGVNDAVSD